MELKVVVFLFIIALVATVTASVGITVAFNKKSKSIGLLAALEGVVAATVWLLLFTNLGGLFE